MKKLEEGNWQNEKLSGAAARTGELNKKEEYRSIKRRTWGILLQIKFKTNSRYNIEQLAVYKKKTHIEEFIVSL